MIKNSHDQCEIEPRDLEKPIIAFVLCHPMESSMAPITSELPPCLFPLCNSPVILYVLNWLNVNHIDKVYILCETNHAPFIKKVLRECKARMLMESVEIIDTDDKIYTTGDAIRWIDTWNQAANEIEDCIIVPGTLVTNAPLKTLVSRHIGRKNNYLNLLKKRKKGLQPIITSVFTKSNDIGYSVMIAEDGMIMQLHSPPILNIDVKKPPMIIDQELFKSYPTVRVKTGLNDSKIYICSVQVLSNFHENFDWKSVLDDCIPTQISQEDLFGHSAYAEVVPTYFATCIDDLPNYFQATSAIIHRWLYPVVVEMNLFSRYETESLVYADVDEELTSFSYSDFSATLYRLERDLIYLNDNVYPSLKAKMGHSIVIGEKTEILEDCVINNSVVGSRCYLGQGCVIQDCIIWDNVRVGDGAKLNNCIIASGTIISPNVTISFGCIVSFNSNVDIDLPPCRRLTSQSSEYDDECPIEDNSPDWLNRYVQEREYLALPEDSTTIEYVPTPMHEIPLLKMWLEISPEEFPIDYNEIQLDHTEQIPEDEIELEEEEEEEELFKFKDDDEFIILNVEFQAAAKDLLNTLIDNLVDSSQTKSEFISLKNSMNVDLVDCAVSIMLAISTHWPLDEIQDPSDLKNYPLLNFLINDMMKSFLEQSEEQIDFLFWWQSYCAKTSSRNSLFVDGLKILTSTEIISYESLNEWQDEQEDCTEAQKKLYQTYVDLVTDLIK